MTLEQQNVLSDLKLNIELLVKRIKMLEKENRDLKEKIKENESTILKLEEDNRMLNENIKNRKIAVSLAGDEKNEGERKDALRFINGLVREIDNCIALLND